MTRIHPVILSGGSGTRLWPLSRQACPKQFLDLVGEGSLLQQTCRRLAGALFAAPVVLGNHEHRFLIAEQMREAGTQPAAIVLEPTARNTAPAAAVAALMAAREDPGRLVLLAPSDHVIAGHDGFLASMRAGVAAAQAGRIVTFGVRPDAAETGYGYIEAGGGTDGVLDVRRFVEKPPRATAEALVGQGNVYWNSGMFLFAARTLLDAFAAHRPELLAACEAALARAVRDLDFLRLDEAAYATCDSISLDHALMEKAGNTSCVPLAAEWSDLGTWPAVWQLANKDADGNAGRGDVILMDSRNSYAHSADGACLALVGLDNVMAIATRDAILVAARDRAQETRALVDRLAAQGRREAFAHTRVYRPWGWYEGLDRGPRFQVKRLMVRPGAQLSLQRHVHRAEHWTVVSGTAEVTLDGRTFLLSENESTYIPIGARHRLANPGKVPAMLVEVQSGAYLEEDDIVRFEDDYGR